MHCKTVIPHSLYKDQYLDRNSLALFHCNIMPFIYTKMYILIHFTYIPCVCQARIEWQYRLTLKDLSIHGYIITLSMTIRANSVLYDPTYANTINTWIPMNSFISSYWLHLEFYGRSIFRFNDTIKPRWSIQKFYNK